ncbi:MAG: ABC transporter permease [Candidatus Bathyarchaeia archaeon]
MRLKLPSKIRIFKENSFWDLAWKRFKRKKLGLLGLSLVLMITIMGVFAPLLALYDPNDQSALIYGPGAYAPPSLAHPLGTDRFGFDVYSRILYGARTALIVGLLAAIFAAIIGISVGAVAGYLGKQVDELLMRFTEAFMLVPSFIVILFLVRIFSILSPTTFLGNIPLLNLWIIIFVLGLFDWPPIARVARSQFLKLKEQEFVEAARCLGASTWKIIFNHILPNALPPIAVLAALEVGNAMLMEAMISFLGFGDPNIISWGQMLTFAAQDMQIAPWVVIAPGVFIFLMIFGSNVLAESLSDALNPRLKE